VRPEELFLKDIVQACAAIRNYARDGEQAFVRSAMAVDAVCFRIIAIGEAIGQLNQLNVTLSDQGVQLRANDYKRIRNELAHAYWRQYAEQIWAFVVNEIPRLERAAAALRRAPDKQGDRKTPRPKGK
jgi:uncharacterized protein with HEPN domain